MKNFPRKLLLPLLLLITIIVLDILTDRSTEIINSAIYPVLSKTYEIVVILIISWMSVNLIAYGKVFLAEKYDLSVEDNLKARKVLTQFTVIQRVLNFIIMLVALSLILMKFEGIRKIGISLLASAGIAGIILGLAAQKLLTTMLAGLQIALTQPIRLDDVVIVEKEWGWIEEITLTYVVVRIWDKRRLIVPTTYFIEKPFENWTRNTSEILGTVFIYTDYSVPIDKLRDELQNIVASDKHWDKKVCVLQVTNATEKTMELRALVSANTSPDAWELRVNVREKLISYLQKNFAESLPRTRILMEKQ